MSRLAALALGSLLLAVPRPVLADAPRCGPHVAALYPYVGFFAADAQSGGSGIDKDMFDELARRSGCELRQVVESRVRIWEQMRRGAVQLTLSAIVTPGRRELAARVASLAAFEADPALRLLTVRGYAHGDALDAAARRLQEQGRIVHSVDFNAALRMLRAGRADAMLVLRSGVTQAQAAFTEPGALAVLDWAPQELSLVTLELSRHMPEADRQRLRSALQAMLADGSVHETMKRHLD
jgi:polar amino acid transport system substrate-binding protein